MTQLYPFQHDGTRFLAERQAALLADEPGTGKTVQAIAACDAIRANTVLVICPASARINWKREFQRFQSIRRKALVIASGADELDFDGVTICSFDLASRATLHAKLMANQYDALIIDESHFLKGRKTRRTTAILGPKCTQKGGLAERASRVFALSGTPAPNHPAELWPMARALFPEAITRNGQVMDYWTFLYRFCSWRKTEFGIQVTGGKNIPELRSRIAPFILRRKKKDVLKDLPPIRFEILPLSPLGILKEMRILEDGPEGDAIREVLENAHGGDGLAGVSLQVAQLRRVTGLAKVKPVVAQVQDELVGGLNKIIIFAHHKDVIHGLHDDLRDHGVVALHGGTSATKRQSAIDAFQNDPGVRVFIGQLAAAGTAITLTAASNVLFVESSWVPAENAQAAMRCHRIGQRDGVLVRFATLAGSLDEWITETVRRKTAVLTALFD